MGCALVLLGATGAVAQPVPATRESLLAQSGLADQHRQRGAELARIAAGQTGPEQANTQADALYRYRQANSRYAAVADGYRSFFAAHPDEPDSAALHDHFAHALFWARDYDRAARVYADVAAATTDARLRVTASYLAVKSQEAWIRLQTQRRAFDPCEALRAGIPAAEITDEAGARLLTEEQIFRCSAPPATGTTVRELAIPEAVQTLVDLRLAYIDRVSVESDRMEMFDGVVTPDAEHRESTPPFRWTFAYLNARTQLRFGYVLEAETGYRAILAACDSRDVACDTAFEDLNNLYGLMGRQHDQAALAREEQRRPSLRDPAPFRPGFTFFGPAEQAPATEARALYERAAVEMQAAVDTHPNHPQAALALYYVALAYERTDRFDSATQTYQRITRDFDHTNDSAGHPLTGEERAQRINILEASNFRVAVNLERIFDFDNSIRFYQRVASDPRFATAADHADHVRDSLATIARIRHMQVPTTAPPSADARVAPWNAVAPPPLVTRAD